MNKRLKNIFLIFAICASVAGAFSIKASAQEFKYSVLAPLPGTTEGDCDPANPGAGCETTLQKYLPGVFDLAIGVSAVFAVLVIVFGGFKYMTTDALQGKEEGKDMIWNAIKGLFLVIGAWLILYTINPNLLNLSLTIDRASIAKPAGGGGTLGGTITGGVPMTNAEIAESKRVQKLLEGSDPSIKLVGTYTGPCTEGQTTKCVNLNGLTQTTIDGVLALRNEFGQFINITGGTEAGHSTTGGHPTGDSLDFGQLANPNYQAFSNYITIGRTPVPTSLGPQYTLKINGRDVTFLKESDPDHWHVTFK